MSAEGTKDKVKQPNLSIRAQWASKLLVRLYLPFISDGSLSEGRKVVQFGLILFIHSPRQDYIYWGWMIDGLITREADPRVTANKLLLPSPALPLCSCSWWTDFFNFFLHFFIFFAPPLCCCSWWTDFFYIFLIFFLFFFAPPLCSCCSWWTDSCATSSTPTLVMKIPTSYYSSSTKLLQFLSRDNCFKMI